MSPFISFTKNSFWFIIFRVRNTYVMEHVWQSQRYCVVNDVLCLQQPILMVMPGSRSHLYEVVLFCHVVHFHGNSGPCPSLSYWEASSIKWCKFLFKYILMKRLHSVHIISMNLKKRAVWGHRCPYCGSTNLLHLADKVPAHKSLTSSARP